MSNVHVAVAYESNKVVSFKDLSPRVAVKQILPFRVKFQTLGLPLSGEASIPGIGVAIIGTNFYVR